MRRLIFLALVSVSVFSALNWQAQLQTQQRLDALAATLSEREATAPPTTAPPPVENHTPLPPVVPVQARNAVPREADGRFPPYVIEAPDILTIEVAAKDPQTGKPELLSGHAVSGQHIVRPDGTVGLGQYGSVYVAGLSLAQVKQAIEKHLRKYLNQPEVTLDIIAYNSKCYYVITDSADFGEQVTRFPCTGNETVLDAVTQIGGLRATGKTLVRVVRPSANGSPDQILQVDWKAITQNGVVTTNFQLLPGDRLFVTRAK